MCLCFAFFVWLAGEGQAGTGESQLYSRWLTGEGQPSPYTPRSRRLAGEPTQCPTGEGQPSPCKPPSRWLAGEQNLQSRCPTGEGQPSPCTCAPDGWLEIRIRSPSVRRERDNPAPARCPPDGWLKSQIRSPGVRRERDSPALARRTPDQERLRSGQESRVRTPSGWRKTQLISAAQCGPAMASGS